jgi:hypothetical protein
MRACEYNNQKIINVITDCYKEFKLEILKDASLGWFFTDSFERELMVKRTDDFFIDKTFSKKINISHSSIQDKQSLLTARETINFINNLNDIKKKFSMLKKIVESNNSNLTNDSFKENRNIDIFGAQERTFNPKKINIIIIGSGITGLFLANTIKHQLGSLVNVLVLDNRSYKINTLKTFDRSWITYLPSYVLQKFTPSNIRVLLECFGADNKIGLPINIIETILMLSCKDQGVNFYFSPKIDYSKLNNKNITLFFDATGGRIKDNISNLSTQTLFNIEVKNIDLNLTHAGIIQLHNKTYSEPHHIKFALKGSGSIHYPYIHNSKIHTYMIKLSGLTKELTKKVFSFIKNANDLNLFYVWEGSLKEEINESLVFINLTAIEYDLMILRINTAINLKKFLNQNLDIKTQLNAKIISFLDMLVTIDSDHLTIIERPFSYYPYVNMNPEHGFINDKQIFPIGDSFYCGHPKLGNGLSVHLEFINLLVEKILVQIPSYKIS